MFPSSALNMVHTFCHVFSSLHARAGGGRRGWGSSGGGRVRRGAASGAGGGGRRRRVAAGRLRVAGGRLREDVRAAPLARKVGALAVLFVVVEVPAAVERVPLLRRLVEGRRRSPHRRSKPRSWSSCRGRRGSAPRVGAGARRRGRLAAAVRARARACAGAARERAGAGARARGGQARLLLQPVLHARAVELVAKVVLEGEVAVRLRARGSERARLVPAAGCRPGACALAGRRGGRRAGPGRLVRARARACVRARGGAHVIFSPMLARAEMPSLVSCLTSFELISIASIDVIMSWEVVVCGPVGLWALLDYYYT